MKKFFKFFFPLAVIMAFVSLPACKGGDGSDDDGYGGSSKVSSSAIEKIIEKYDDGDNLSASDYNKLITYVDNALDEVEPLMKKLKKAEKAYDDDKIDALRDKIMDLSDKYEYYEEALRIIRRADDNDLGSAKSNARKLIKKERKFEEKY